MNFNEYQSAAEKTAIYPRKQAIIYPALGLAGESGEVSEKVKKWLRDGHINAGELHKEIGDVLWYLAALCSDLQETFGNEYSLENAAIRNYQKLKSRQERGVLGGSGDNR